MNQQKIKMKQIKPPLGRARVNYGDVASLKQSMQDVGLINPITVRPTDDGMYEIIAGERRWRAAHSLEWEEIDAVILPADIGELDQKVIELHENLMRKDFDWVEEVRLKKKIHDLQMQKHGAKTSTAKDAKGWSMRETAAMLGESVANVSRDIKLADMLDSVPEIAQADNKAKAFRIVQGAADVFKSQEIEAAIKANIKKDPSNLKQKLVDSYILGDFFKEAKKLPDHQFDLIEIDPPYGIDLGEQKKNSGIGMSEYNEVSRNDYESFIKDVLRECNRLLKENGWLLMWFAPEPHQETVYNMLRLFKFNVRRLPAYWVKPNGQTNAPALYLANNVEPFYYARRGNARLKKQGHIATFTGTKEPSFHPTAKPVELMKEILTTFVDVGSSILVPFAGSGNTLIAARMMGMNAIGYDLSEYYRSEYIKKVEAIDV